VLAAALMVCLFPSHHSTAPSSRFLNTSKQEKVAALKAAGAEGLQVIIDFDHTITRYYNDDGSRCTSSHGAVQSSSLFSFKFGCALFIYFIYQSTSGWGERYLRETT
jgi:hypothetical protein